MVGTSVSMLFRALSLVTLALQTRRRPVWRVATLLAVSMAALLLSADDLPECQKFKAAPIPRDDQPTPAQAKALGDCDSNELYYGFSQPSDSVKARLCAYGQYSGEKEKNDPAFYGAAILMMIYANGKGTARNFDLAMRFACEDEVSYRVETQGRLQHLAKLKIENWKGSDFDYCDDVVSDRSREFCSANQERFAEAKRKKQMDAILSKWSSQDKQAFAKVQLEEQKYIEAMSSEVDYIGTSWHDDLRGKVADMETVTISVLSRLESGKFADSSNTGFAKADAELNAVYKETIQKLRTGEAEAHKTARAGFFRTTISADGVRETERIWLKYLTAWIAFVQYKYPLAPADGVRAWLTEARTKHLNELMIY